MSTYIHVTNGEEAFSFVGSNNDPVWYYREGEECDECGHTLPPHWADSTPADLCNEAYCDDINDIPVRYHGDDDLIYEGTLLTMLLERLGYPDTDGSVLFEGSKIDEGKPVNL